jgi:hypothetical protein
MVSQLFRGLMSATPHDYHSRSGLPTEVSIMRFLFYLEPHPIRGSFTSFQWIAEQFIFTLLADSTHWQEDSLHLYSNATLTKRFTEKHPHLTPHVLTPTDQEEALFQREYRDAWEQEGIPRWRMLLEGGTLAQEYVQLLDSLYARHPFDALIYWGTNQAVVDFGKKHNIPTLAMELGCTRAPHMDSLVMDPVGVNGNSIFTQLNLEDLQRITKSNYPDLPGSEANRILPPTKSTLPWKSGDRPIAFLPLQLYDDANLLRFAPYHSMLEFLQDVAPNIASAGYRIVVKEHPGTFSRKTDKRRTHEIVEYLKQFPDHIFLPAQKTVSNADIFASTSLVVTVNSSVGYEASLRGIPTVVMGQANYKIGEILPSLQEVLSPDFDLAAYHQRLQVLHRFMGSAVLHSARAMHYATYFLAAAKLTIAAMQNTNGNPLEFSEYFLKHSNELSTVALTIADAPPLPPSAARRQSLHRWLKQHPILLQLAYRVYHLLAKR